MDIIKKDIVYFELNNWSAGKDYPNAEPFIEWCGNDLALALCNDDWVKENKLCVVADLIDMSINWCITATREWVEHNCPKLLSNEFTFHRNKTGLYGCEEFVKEYPYRKFLRYPDEYGQVRGRFGTLFLDYTQENIGIKWEEDRSH